MKYANAGVSHVVAGAMMIIMVMLFVIVCSGRGEAQVNYQIPHDDVVQVIDTPWSPRFIISPDGSRVALVKRNIHPPISQLARPFIRLAGIRIDPGTNAHRTLTRYEAVEIKNLSTNKDTPVDLPRGNPLGVPLWRGDGKALAVEEHSPDGTGLWIVDPSTGKARKVPGVQVNHTLTYPMVWMPDNRHLLVLTVPQERGAVPDESPIPEGPNVEEASGSYSQMPTYQDLLASPGDDRLFLYFCTSRPVLVDSENLAVTSMEQTGLFMKMSPSPDGRHILWVELLEPFSRRVPYYYFRRRFHVTDLAGKSIHVVATSPASEEVPRHGVPVGVRNIEWMPGYDDARLFWTQATDGGDPSRDVPFRDSLWSQEAPFDKRPLMLKKIPQRFTGIDWLDTPGMALVHQYDRTRQWRTTFLMDLDKTPVIERTVFDLSARDAYNHPGEVVKKILPGGFPVAISHGGKIFFSGEGSSPDGDMPFLDKLDPATGEKERLWQCPGGRFEEFMSFNLGRFDEIITLRQSPEDPPDFFVINLAHGKERQLTEFPSPAPWTRQVKKKIIRYERSDGLPLSGILYLPPGYREGTRLPLVMWAYPREYAQDGVAGQVRGSPYRFARLFRSDPRFFLSGGYAFFEASMPVVGDPDTVNNTFISQIVDNARSAVDRLCELGYADRNRVLIGGHSYGAFMAAHLLAHSDLFAAGIARSGAFNRTLTPFGFQAERRTLWEAPEFYLKISPISHADKIKKPLLLIHGEMDSNSGTYPLQSRRMFQAIRGNGGTARLVMLPREEHWYYARESCLHVIWEMLQWADKYLTDQDD